MRKNGYFRIKIQLKFSFSIEYSALQTILTHNWQKKAASSPADHVSRYFILYSV